MTIGTPVPHRGAYLLAEIFCVACVAIAIITVWSLWP